MLSSGMTPGPLGMSDTRPSAAAPAATAARASAALRMQQTLTRGTELGSTAGAQDTEGPRDGARSSSHKRSNLSWSCMISSSAFRFTW